MQLNQFLILKQDLMECTISLELQRTETDVRCSTALEQLYCIVRNAILTYVLLRIKLYSFIFIQNRYK